MSAKRKTVLKGFDYMHCDDFAKYLSDMAAKGWHFVEWGAGLKFEKGEPEQAVYAVEVFQKASENDMRPEPNTQEFAEYCEAAGWKFLDAKQKFCIFKKIDPSAIELYTPEERVNNAMKSTFSGSAIILLVLYGLNSVLRWSSLATAFERNIFSGSFFFQIAIWTVMFIGQFLMLLSAFYKSRRLKKKVHRGEKIYIGNRQDGKYHVNIRDIYIGILILMLMYYFYILDRMDMIIFNILLVVGILTFFAILNKMRPERDTGIAIQLTFVTVLILFIIGGNWFIFSKDMEDKVSKDEPLLIPADYRECDYEVDHTSYNGDENFLGSVDRYIVNNSADDYILYYIYRSEYAWILDKIWKVEIADEEANKEVVDCTLAWDAQKAIRNSYGTYNIRYENAILIFRDDKDVYLSEKQIDSILDKLELGR